MESAASSYSKSLRTYYEFDEIPNDNSPGRELKDFNFAFHIFLRSQTL